MKSIEQIQQELAQMISQRRKQSGLTQKQLAEFAGVGKTVVFDIEHGKKSIQFNTLLKVLQVLNIAISFDEKSYATR